MPLYELGQAIFIVGGACILVYLLRKPIARLFGQTERKAGEAREEMTQAYYEGKDTPTPKEERTGEE